MTNPIEPARWPISRRVLPLTASRPARALVRAAASLATWARLTNGSLRLGGADVCASLDRQSRALLWPVLSEAIAAIGVLDAADAPVETSLAALATLADRIRGCAMTSPPPPEGAEPPQLLLLEILIHDLQPCLTRWQPRLEAAGATGRAPAAWPLGVLCRADLARARERLVERAWQLGIGLGLSGLDRLLPARPATTPAFVAPHELAAAEAAATGRPDPASLRAGWQIYVEAATRLPAAVLPTGLGAGLAAVEALAAEIRTALKSMPPPGGKPDTIVLLALGLLTECLEPVLAAWQPRYRKFAETGRPEAKWRRAAECRAALDAACERCAAKIRTLASEIGAPPLPPAPAALEEDAPPLQLPAPAMRS
jgi:hypothetical protein